MGRHSRTGAAAVRERLAFWLAAVWALLPLWAGIAFGIWLSVSNR